MENPTLDKHSIQVLLKDYSIETTPKAARKIGDFSMWLKPQTQVYVTFLPGSAVEDTLTTCAMLKKQGMRPVPHLALRSIESEAQLHRIFTYLAEQHIDEVLLIAGALSQPKGDYRCVAALLQSGILEQYALRGIGFAGHPEGSPDIPLKDIQDAEIIKQHYAHRYPRDYWFVSQFCFAPQPVIAWQERLLAQEIHLPLRIGIAGVATIATLLKHAKACGIGPSISYLFKHGKSMGHLMKTSTPDKLVYALATYCAQHPEQRIAGLHFYPLGGFVETVQWIQAIEAGGFVMTDSGFHIV